MRFWTRNYPGLIILHCHLLQHEDGGMMGYYVILNESQSIPIVCPNNIDTKTSILSTTEFADPIVMHGCLFCRIIGLAVSIAMLENML